MCSTPTCCSEGKPHYHPNLTSLQFDSPTSHSLSISNHGPHSPIPNRKKKPYSGITIHSTSHLCMSQSLTLYSPLSKPAYNFSTQKWYLQLQQLLTVGISPLPLDPVGTGPPVTSLRGSTGSGSTLEKKLLAPLEALLLLALLNGLLLKKLDESLC